jgi:hypothetical protein
MSIFELFIKQLLLKELRHIQFPPQPRFQIPITKMQIDTQKET